MELNEAQQKAVSHREGPCLVLAGPGSGKTAVIARRTKLLVESGVDPGKILVVTFTKAAAMEMKGRFQRSIKDRNAPVWFGTFHAVFFSILKHAYHYNVNSIVKEDVKKQFFREAIAHYRLEAEDESELISDLQGEISLVKGGMMDLEHYYSKSCSEEIFREIYRAYQKMLRNRRLIDFDDMLVYCYELLTQRKDILAMWQQKFQYILIDEFQDINRLQYAIIKLLALPENNLFIVGDDDQSIYRFRGAMPDLMLNFDKDYPDTKKILLNINYRCPQPIVEGAAKVIGNNEKRFVKEILAAKEEGSAIAIKEFSGTREENKRIAQELLAYHEKGIPYTDMAILSRTNTQPRTLVEVLMQYNIPFCMKDTIPNLYEHFIGRDIINYIRAALGNRERAVFLKIANRPKRYISRDALDSSTISFEAMRNFYQDKAWMMERIDQWEYDLKWLKRLTPYAAVRYIRRGIGYDDFLEEYAQFRRIHLEDLAEVLDEIEEAAKPFEDYAQWFEHIEAYGKELKEQAQKQDARQEGVMLSTMHSAKGLEYSVVYIPDANEGITPHHRASLEEDLEEERRMFYVAMTRAKKQLHIYYIKERFQKEMDPSRFVEELMKEEEGGQAR